MPAQLACSVDTAFGELQVPPQNMKTSCMLWESIQGEIVNFS